MSAPQPKEVSCGAFRGWVDADLFHPPLLEALAGLPERVAEAGEELRAGRDQVVHLSLPGGNGELDVVVKTFGRRSVIRDWSDRRKGSRARRSWDTARVLVDRGVHTAAPVACLERWRGRRLVESYFVSRFLPELTDLRRELIRLYRHDPICWKLMNLLQVTADGIRALHNAGVEHGDLGNQNVLLRRTGDGQWEPPFFVDLNRAMVRDRLDEKSRARDLARLHLPSDLRRVFLEMYLGRRPDGDFKLWESQYRQSYEWHAATRRWRHPIRSRRRTRDPALVYPDSRDIWIWDDRSVQAINVLKRKDRNRLHRRRDILLQAVSTALALPGVVRRYRALLDEAYRKPVDMAGRIGLAIEPGTADVARELAWLEQLPAIPVLVRCYFHRGEEAWTRTAELVTHLAGSGREVTLAMVQNREAAKNPERWRDFLETVLEQVHDQVTWVEIGHAVNRVKWGVWTLAEQRRLLAPAAALKDRYPDLRIMGPAGIDFEYPYAVTALRGLPRGLALDAFSHHLYVDRRGAPENRQGPFATLEKCALARAVAGWSRGCRDRLIISEVNWPLAGTGVWSPVVSPYDTPGPRKNSPNVCEEQYADFLIRYLLICLCSGMAERVYWWRLVARGFGLIDDTDPDAWRARPAFHRLIVFLARVGQATFEERTEIGEAAWFRFRTPDQERLWVGYSPSGPMSALLPCRAGERWDADGRPLGPATHTIALTGAPTYLLETR